MKRILLLILLTLSLSAHAQQAVYDRYAPREELLVAYAHGYRLDSADRIDALILQAKDSAAWESLREEFDLRALSPEQQLRLAQHDVKLLLRRDASDPTRPISEGGCILIASHRERLLCLFYPQSPEQEHKLFINQFNTK